MASECHIGMQRDSFRLSSVLSSALFKWLLMFLLFLDALFLYLVTKFARYCKLQTPCLLCSRLDHIFGNEKPGFYRDLICTSRKVEISSLACCHAHRKLANVNEMCGACLISLAAEKKSNPETYRSLVGKLNADHGFDRLSRVGYNEVKVTSDSDSENPMSENDDGNNLSEELKEDIADRCLKPEPGIIIPNNLSMPPSDDATMDKLIHGNSLKFEPSLSIPEEQFLPAGESHDLSMASDVTIGHSLEEVNCNKNGASNDSPALPEIISQENGSISSIGENTKTLNSTTSDMASNQLVSGSFWLHSYGSKRCLQTCYW